MHTKGTKTSSACLSLEEEVLVWKKKGKYCPLGCGCHLETCPKITKHLIWLLLQLTRSWTKSSTKHLWCQELTVECEQADLLWWHYCLGNAPFKTLKSLADIGILPCHLAQAQIQMCPACRFAKMHQKPWWTKGQHKVEMGKRIVRPG